MMSNYVESEIGLHENVAKRKNVWAGEEMEMKHQLQWSKEKAKSAKGNEDYATVDLSQFRNTEVGVGYQAKGVVRQRSGYEESNISKTKRKETLPPQIPKADNALEQNIRQQPFKNDSERIQEKDMTNTSASSNKAPEFNKFLQSKGIRDFRREIEKILSQAYS
mmetsp:Transcript_1797/g.2588  ORF Transcript_1797/g.2588 Transcript_1797/m.2588 type:complete len:164 (+) Transcript_1797:139-630(+)